MIRFFGLGLIWFEGAVLAAGLLAQEAPQPLSPEARPAQVAAAILEPLIAGDLQAAIATAAGHAQSGFDQPTLREELQQVMTEVEREETAWIDAFFSFDDGVLVRTVSDSGRRLLILFDRLGEGEVRGIRMPAGGWALPPPPPEGAIPGLLDPLEQPRDVAFVNVTVLPMDSQAVIGDRTVVVRGGMIESIGPSETTGVPANALVIDGSGRYLIPGLVDMHAHIPWPSEGEGAVERTLFLFVAQGVTTVRGMMGHPSHLQWRDRAARNEIVAPRIYAASPSLNGVSAPTPEAGRRLVEDYSLAGYDVLKLHPGLSRETYDALVTRAEELGMAWGGHVPAEVGLSRALEVQQSSIDHLDSYLEALAGYGGGIPQEEAGWFGLGLIDEMDESSIPEVAAATTEAGVWNVPTQSLFENLLSLNTEPEDMAQWPEMRYMPEPAVQRWVESTRNVREQVSSARHAERVLDLRRRLVHSLHTHGAGLLLGADAPQDFNVPGFATIRELNVLVEIGLTPYEALVTGTRNVAAFMGTEAWGTIGEGHAADLILLSGNPFEDMDHLSRPEGVMIRGQWLEGAEIERRLSLIEDSLNR